jgi:hypothetical protein
MENNYVPADRASIIKLKFAMAKAQIPIAGLDDILDQQQARNWRAALKWLLRNGAGGGNWRRMAEQKIANLEKMEKERLARPDGEG